MNITDLKTWYESQPGGTSYHEIVKFFMDIDDINRSQAELEVAKLHKSGDSKIIKTSNGETRVFLTPLPKITEEMVRNLWDAPPGVVNEDLTMMVEGLHNRTGKDTQEIYDALNSMDSVEIGNGKFKWVSNESD